MKHNKKKMYFFMDPAHQYLLETMATRAGYVRTGSSSLAGRANTSQYVEDILKQHMNVQQYSVDQLQQMRDYQISVNDSRCK